MSKFSNMLNMIILLKSRGRMKSKELAEELEVDERMIRKYRRDIEMAGIHIESVAGAYGGYVLKSDTSFLDFKIEADEYVALKLAYEQLKSTNFIYIKEFEGLVDKLNILQSDKLSNTNFSCLTKEVISIDYLEERKKCLDINAAIISKRKLKIKYFSLTSGESERVVQPYAVINYKGSVYFVALCEKNQAVLEFKVSRIKEYTVLEEKYEIPENFNLKKYTKDSLGIYRDQALNIKLRIYKPMSYIISEKLWVENQKIHWNEDQSIIFEASMNGKTEIISWILSMKSNVEILEPISLKEEVREEVEKMLKSLK